MKSRTIEILAPAGAYDSLAAAIRAGADSIYFGVGALNMRSRASREFTDDDIAKIARLCRKAGVKSYLALNTVIYDSDMDEMKKLCDRSKAEGVSAVIATDISVINYADSIDLPVHISVQENISNIEAVRFFAKFAEVIVLARELTLDQIREIIRKIKEENIKGPSGRLIKIEIFAHGALCVSISGKCYMSLAAYNASANRGDCYQNCRRKFRVIDEETGYEMLVDNNYVMSYKDLCTVRIVDKLLDSGVSILKIEGRGRSPDYVYTVTKAYCEAVDLYAEGKLTPEKLERFEKELETVFNRGFWHGGYYLGDKAGEWSGISGSRASRKKEAIGFISNYYQKIKVAELTLNAGDVSVGDEILITGPTTGAVRHNLDSIKFRGKTITTGLKSQVITFPFSTKLRRNDKVFRLSKVLSET